MLSRVFGVLETPVLVGILCASLLTSVLLATSLAGHALLVLGLGFTGRHRRSGWARCCAADRRSAGAVAALAPKVALLEVLDLFADAPRTTLEQLARAVEEVGCPAARSCSARATRPTPCSSSSRARST